VATVAAVVGMLLRRQRPRVKLRIVAYNVERFKRFDTVSATLAKLTPELVALNEVADAASVERMAGLLGLPHWHFFGHARNGSYGNAVLSRRAFNVTAEKHLAGGTVLQEQRIVRGLLVADFPGLFRFAVTHLDHVSDLERRAQLESALEALDEADDVLR